MRNRLTKIFYIVNIFIAMYFLIVNKGEVEYSKDLNEMFRMIYYLTIAFVVYTLATGITLIKEKEKAEEVRDNGLIMYTETRGNRIMCYIMIAVMVVITKNDIYRIVENGIGWVFVIGVYIGMWIRLIVWDIGKMVKDRV